jgi:uncharacterized membrane protein
MNRLAAKVAVLAGIVAFCVTMIIGLLRSYDPLAVAFRALVALVLVAVVACVCICVAMSVASDGMRNYEEESTPQNPEGDGAGKREA